MLTLFSPTSNLSLGNPWYFYCIHTFVFSRISYSWDHITSVQSLSRVQLFAPHGLQRLVLPVYHRLLELTQSFYIESVMPSNHLILCHPLLLLPSIFPSIRVFSNYSVLRMRWPKYWSFNFNISPSNDYSGLLSFRMDWLDLLAVQGTLFSNTIVQHSDFYMVQLSHPYMTTGKTIALSRWTFVGKVMSLFFNMPSRLVITFLPRSKHLFFFFIIYLSIIYFF